MSLEEGGSGLRSERPTLKTIARISGLAVTTVSRALGDAPDISRTTKDRVRKIAKEIGYVPNRAGVRLRTGRTNVISLVLATENNVLNMTSSLIAAISSGLQGTPYHLVMMPELPTQNPLDAIRYIVETRSADAIIFNRVQPDDARVRYLQEQGFPFVTHGRSKSNEEHSYYDFDNEAFGRIAVETLVDRGRTNILFLAPPVDQSYALHMIEGATGAAGKHGVALKVMDGVTSDSQSEAIIDALDKALSDDGDVDALIVASPNATMVATAHLTSIGRTIGGDIDVQTKETVPFLKLFNPAILTIREDIQVAGENLARAVVCEINRNGGPFYQVITSPDDTIEHNAES